MLTTTHLIVLLGSSIIVLAMLIAMHLFLHRERSFRAMERGVLDIGAEKSRTGTLPGDSDGLVRRLLAHLVDRGQQEGPERPWEE